jgi:membrane associated rhomboid family serine protease
MQKLTFRYYPQPVSPETELMEKRIFKVSMVVPAIFVLFFWVVSLIEYGLGLSFVEGEVFPRRIDGLQGILTSPFVHGSFKHLVNNSVPFFLLSTALFFFYRKLAFRIFLINYFLAGLFLWVIGRESWHIGASGVVYGLAGFLFFSGLFRWDARLLTISLIVVFLYGSMVWGLLPIDPSMSWDGHWAGAASGFLLALWFKNQGPPRRKFEWEEDADLDESENQEDGMDYEDDSAEDSVER